MATSQTFREFEHTGWADDSVTLSYHRYLGEVTQACIPALIEAAGLKAGDRVLDVACGAGYVAAAARDQGADAVGVDFSAAQVRLAEQSYPVSDLSRAMRKLSFHRRRVRRGAERFRSTPRPQPGDCYGRAYCSETCRYFCLRFMVRGCKVCRVSMFYDAIRAHGSLDVGLPHGPISSAVAIQISQEMLGRAGFTGILTNGTPAALARISPRYDHRGDFSGHCARGRSSQSTESRDPCEDQTEFARKNPWFSTERCLCSPDTSIGGSGPPVRDPAGLPPSYVQCSMKTIMLRWQCEAACSRHTSMGAWGQPRPSPGRRV
jgi:SAM-dependent methyltransferase